MATALRRGSLVAAALLLVSCGGSGSDVSSATAPSRTRTASSSSAPASTSAPAPETFTSKTYGYTLTLPARWSSIQAQKAWDGKSALSSDAAVVDQLVGTYNASSSGVAAPSTRKLAGYTAAVVAANARDHGDTCPPKPDQTERITIGGGPGVLLAYNCGILINLATAVHHDVGYQFLFRDPTVSAATDPADHETFLAMLKSVQFPD